MLRQMQVTIITLLLYMASTVNAGPMGNWTGSGGDGYALVFTHLGYRLHREFLMEKYNLNQLQLRDQIPMDAFLQAVDSTKVIVSHTAIYDRSGHEQTAVYYTPNELRTQYQTEGMSDQQIQKILTDLPSGLIIVNEARFLREIQADIAVALATVFHEYARVMGLSEDNYRTTARTYDLAFFRNLTTHSSTESKQTYSQARSNNKLATDKIAMIDSEKQRVKAEISEDTRDLEITLAKRKPIIESQRGAFTRVFNAYADMMEAVSMLPSISPSSNAPLVRALGPVMEAQADMGQKLSELEVITMQVNFLTGNIQRNMSFFGKIVDKRNELFLQMLDQP